MSNITQTPLKKLVQSLKSIAQHYKHNNDATGFIYYLMDNFIYTEDQLDYLLSHYRFS